MKLAKVISIAQYQNRNLKDVMRHLCAKAETGELRGIFLAAQFGDSDHELCVLGSYKDDPYEAYIPLAQVLHSIMNDVEQKMGNHGK